MRDSGKPADEDVGRKRQASIYIRGLGRRKPVVPVDPMRLEEKAREAMSPEGFAYMAGGAGQESSMRANREAFERWRIVPRVLRDVSQRDLSVELFGERLRAPLLLAPIGVLEMAHAEADLAVARAAAAADIPLILSNQASYSMEDCAAAMNAGPRWFQLYWSKSDELVRNFVLRAERSGCRAIVLTLDTSMLGWRPRDLDLANLPFLRGLGIAQYTSDPVFRTSLSEPLPEGASEESPPINLATLRSIAEAVRKHPDSLPHKLLSGEPLTAIQRFIATYSRPSLTWDDLAYLRDLTSLPILLKGILHADDAREAVQRGINGIIVSNHGGRQLDGAIAALDALPQVVEAVEGEVPILFDSGIRGGADIFKALALGATAVCLGRPYAYGLALAGEQGVSEVIQNLLAEFDLTLGIAGCTSVAEVTRDALARAP